MKDSERKPGIQFCEFDSEWEQHQFSDMVLIERGGSPRPIEEYITNASDGLNWVKIGDAPSQGNYITKTAQKIKVSGLSKTRQVVPGDLILSNSMSFGKPYIMGINGCIHDGWLLIRDTRHQFDLQFLCYLLGTNDMLQQYKSLAGGSTVNNLNKELVGGTKIAFPCLNEQQRIGEFFYTFDQYFSLQQRKYIQLVNMKSSLLEKMFPHDGAKVPEIRFNGFEDDWRQHKLGEMGTLKNGMNFTKDAMGKGFPFVNLQNIFGRNVIDDKNLGLAQATEGQLCEYDLKEGDVLFVRSSVKLEGVGEAAIIPRDLKNTTYSGFIIRFRDNIGLEKNFKRVIFATQSVRKQIMAQATDSANKNISQTSLENLEVFTPNFEEQQKIGQLFANIDNVISAQQQKIEQLKNIKQSFIDKMFVS